MIETPTIVETDALNYAFIHLDIPRAEMHAALPPALNQLHAAVQAQGFPIRPWFSHHYALTDDNFNFEVCLPVDQPFPAAGIVKAGIWPAGVVAQTTHHGDYAGLESAWKELARWIAANGHTPASHIYEHYIVNQGMTKDPAEFRTELSWPLVVKAREDATTKEDAPTQESEQA